MDVIYVIYGCEITLEKWGGNNGGGSICISEKEVGFDLDVEIFTNLLNMNLDEESFKWEQSEFNKLKDSVNKEKAKKYFEEQEGKPIKIYRVNIKIENFLKELLVKWYCYIYTSNMKYSVFWRFSPIWNFSKIGKEKKKKIESGFWEVFNPHSI